MVTHFPEDEEKTFISVAVVDNQVLCIYKLNPDPDFFSYDDLVWNKGDSVTKLKKVLKDLKREYPEKYSELPRIYIKKTIREYIK